MNYEGARFYINGPYGAGIACPFCYETLTNVSQGLQHSTSRTPGVACRNDGKIFERPTVELCEVGSDKESTWLAAIMAEHGHKQQPKPTYIGPPDCAHCTYFALRGAVTLCRRHAPPFPETRAHEWCGDFDPGNPPPVTLTHPSPIDPSAPAPGQNSPKTPRTGQDNTKKQVQDV